MSQKDIPLDIIAPTQEARAQQPDEIRAERQAKRRRSQAVAPAPAAADEEEKPAGTEGLQSSLREFLVDEDVRFSRKMLKDLFGGRGLVEILRHNWKFTLLSIAFTIAYVALGYFTREKMIENDTLSKEVLDRRYKALTRSSELRERTLGSKVERELQDTALRLSTERSYRLPVEKIED